MAKKKGRGHRNPIFYDEKYLGTEPEWEQGKKFTPAELKGRMLHAFNYYNHFYDAKDLKGEIVEWLHKNSKLKPKQIATYKSSDIIWTSITMGALVRMHDRGAPLAKEQTDHIIKRVKQAIEKTDPSVVNLEQEKEEAKKKKKLDDKIAKSGGPTKSLFETIQAKIRQQANNHVGEFDEELDRVVMGLATKVDAHAYLREKGISQPVATKMKAIIEPMWHEIRDCKKDEQLKEAYASFKGKKLKRVQEFFEKLLSELDNYIKLRKINRKPRAKKIVSADKLVAKLKYKREAKEFKLVSISPKDIIGATMLWTFDCKKRKLTEFQADDHATLTVKGSTIRNFSEKRSVTKTLRRPAEQLPAFMKCGKVALRTFMKEIRAVETRAKPRLNLDVILLRAQ